MGDEDYPIKLIDKEGKTVDIGSKKKDICNCITDADWTRCGIVEVTVIFRDTTGEIISVNEKSPINGSS